MGVHNDIAWLWSVVLFDLCFFLPVLFKLAMACEYLVRFGLVLV